MLLLAGSYKESPVSLAKLRSLVAILGAPQSWASNIHGRVNTTGRHWWQMDPARRGGGGCARNKICERLK